MMNPLRRNESNASMTSSKKASAATNNSPSYDNSSGDDFDTVKKKHNHGDSKAAATTSAAAAAAANAFKMLLLVMMVFQNTATVLVGRYTRTAPKHHQDGADHELYSVNHLLMVCEVSKFVASAVLEWYVTNGRLYESIQIHILQRPMDALKISVPAILYFFQNILLYVALSNLTAPIFQVTYQAKLVTTALLSVIMLQRKYSIQQWICLVALSVGVAIVVLDSSNNKPGTDSRSTKEDTETDTDSTESSGGSSQQQNMFLGLIAVGIACTSSAMAGVYFESVLKKPSPPPPPPPPTATASSDLTTTVSDDPSPPPPPPAAPAPAAAASLWMRNMQLSFFSVLVAFFQNEYNRQRDGANANDKTNDDGDALPYLHGFTGWVWFLVFLQAGGGLLVAAIIKYADNVLKGLATGVSVVFATALSTVLFGTSVSSQFVFGATMILTSVYLFSNPLPARLTMGCKNTKDEHGKPTMSSLQQHKQQEMNKLLPK